MTIQEPVDWLTASVDEQKKLFQVASAVHALLNLDDWIGFWAICLASTPRPHVTPHFKNNFQRGNADKKKVAVIYEWIRDNHWGLATDLAPSLFDPSRMSDWSSYLDEHAIYDELQHRLANQLGLTKQSTGQPIADMRIRLGQDFYFELTSRIGGTLLALEGYEGKWYPLSLHENGETLEVESNAGTQILPLSAKTGQPVCLSDLEHKNLHSYVIVVASGEVIETCLDDVFPDRAFKSSQLDRIAHACQQAAAGSVELHRLNVMFRN